MKYTKDEAYRRYREDPATFWDEYLEESFSHRKLISPDWNNSMMKYHYNLVENAIIESLNFRTLEKESVLDIGCGTGWWFEFYRYCLQVKKYVGIDISKISIKRLKEKYSEDPYAQFEVLDIGQSALPYKTFSVDVNIVSAVGIFFHITDDTKWRNAIKNISSLLKKEGMVFIGDEFGPTTYEKGVWRRFRSLNMYEKELGDNGLSIQKIYKFEWKYGAANNGIRDNILVGVKE